LVEVVPFSCTLPVSKDRVQAWALDATGQRQAPLAVLDDGHGLTLITNSAGAATIWYEIRVAPATASFEQWRQEHFNSTELADSGLSGADGTPAGDGIPNFMKYALALDPRQSAARQHLAEWQIQATPEQRCLRVQFTQAKALTDARVRPLFSTNLTVWFPNLGDVHPGFIQDLGNNSERVTFESCWPATASSFYGQLAVESLGP
jgi:hypothetical protein